MRLSVKTDGRVLLSLPVGCSEADAERFLRQNSQWLDRALSKTRQRLSEQTRLCYAAGEEHLFFGRLLPLRVEPERGRESVAFYEDEIVLYCHPDRTVAQRKKLLYQGYYQQLRPVLNRMLAYWEERLGEPGIEVTLRLMKTEWGSCTPMKRRMTFNVDLVRLPLECIEYVVIHEFSHLTYCDHSPHFWALCDRHLTSRGFAPSKQQRARIRHLIRTCGGD